MKSGKKILMRALHEKEGDEPDFMRRLSHGDLRSPAIAATPLAHHRGAERILHHAVVESALRFVYGRNAKGKGLFS